MDNNRFSLETFRDVMKSNPSLISEITNRSDIVDIDNGSMVIYRENLEKYLEKYMCKTEDDLSDTLWYSYGVFVKIIE